MGDNTGIDGVYYQRNALACLLAKLTLAQGVYRAGRGVDASQSPEWQTVVFIELPTGQISFHIHEREAHLFDGLPEYSGVWDGHTDSEKWARVRHCLGGPEAV